MYTQSLTCITKDDVIVEASKGLCQRLGLDLTDCRPHFLAEYFVRAEVCGDFESCPEARESDACLATSYGFLRLSDGSVQRVWVTSRSLEALAAGAIYHLFDSSVDTSSFFGKLHNEHLSSIIDELPTPVYCKNRDGLYVWCNRAFARDIIGCPQESVVGKKLEDFAEQLEVQLTSIYRSKDEELFTSGGQQVYFVDVVTASKGKRRFQFHKSTLRCRRGDIVGIVGVMVDVTDRLLIEQSLMESERQYEELFNYLLEGVGIADSNGVVTFCNPAFARIFGAQTPAEMVGQHLLDYLPPETREIFGEEVLTRPHTESTRYEIDIVDRKSIRKTILAKVSPRTGADGEHLGIFGAVSDITEQKRLEFRHAMLAAAVEAAAEVIIVTDLNGRIVYANPTFEKESGYTAEEVRGKPASINKSGRHNAEFYDSLWNTIQAGVTWKGRFVNRRKDGGLYFEDATIAPVRDQTGDIVQYVAVKRNVTRELEIEEQLRRSQRIESLGMLAGGIAHDFNNILTAISGYAELLASGSHAGSRHDDDVREIIRAADRASALVRQLLTFSSRSAEMEPEALDVCAHMADLKQMLARMVEEHCVLRLEPCQDPCLVSVNPGHLEQVIVNLVVNARDAMPEGGEIVIRVFSPSTNGNPRGPSLNPDGAYVSIQVEDQGVGMSSQVLERIFDPFFTTKEIGKGTGLGLSTVFGIVKEVGGQISVESDIGKGSCFTVWLPSAGSESDPFGQIASDSTYGQ